MNPIIIASFLLYFSCVKVWSSSVVAPVAPAVASAANEQQPQSDQNVGPPAADNGGQSGEPCFSVSGTLRCNNDPARAQVQYDSVSPMERAHYLYENGVQKTVSVCSDAQGKFTITSCANINQYPQQLLIHTNCIVELKPPAVSKACRRVISYDLFAKERLYGNGKHEPTERFVKLIPISANPQKKIDIGTVQLSRLDVGKQWIDCAMDNQPTGCE